MKFDVSGNQNGPILVCIPGLLGGPEDFRQMTDLWQADFCVVTSDPNAARREKGLSQLTDEVVQEISYDSSAVDIKEFLLANYPGKKYFFVGISLGGKIVYDFAIRYPELFSGAVVTDVGPGSFEESELYSLVFSTVKNIDLELPWAELRPLLHTQIADKSLRILVQSQLSYPGGNPPAVWKSGMQNFKTMLGRQSIDDQTETLASVSPVLAAKGAFITVLKAPQHSGISPAAFAQLRSLACIKVVLLQNCSHFIHVTNKPEIIAAVETLS